MAGEVAAQSTYWKAGQCSSAEVEMLFCSSCFRKGSARGSLPQKRGHILGMLGEEGQLPLQDPTSQHCGRD